LEVSGQPLASAAPPQESAPGTHSTGGWVSSRTGLEAVGKRKRPCPLPGIACGLFRSESFFFRFLSKIVWESGVIATHS